MSSQPKQIVPEPIDPKWVDLVRKITEKTRANKIVWSKTPTGTNASVSGKMQLGFVRAARRLDSPEGWARFTVWDEKGNEILSVDNLRNTLGSLAAASLEPEKYLAPLRNAIGNLFREIEEFGRAEVEKLIEVVDRI